MKWKKVKFSNQEMKFSSLKIPYISLLYLSFLSLSLSKDYKISKFFSRITLRKCFLHYRKLYILEIFWIFDIWINPYFVSPSPILICSKNVVFWSLLEANALKLDSKVCPHSLYIYIQSPPPPSWVCRATSSHHPYVFSIWGIEGGVRIKKLGIFESLP